MRKEGTNLIYKTLSKIRMEDQNGSRKKWLNLIGKRDFKKKKQVKMCVLEVRKIDSDQILYFGGNEVKVKIQEKINRKYNKTKKYSLF